MGQGSAFLIITLAPQPRRARHPASPGLPDSRAVGARFAVAGCKTGGGRGADLRCASAYSAGRGCESCRGGGEPCGGGPALLAHLLGREEGAADLTPATYTPVIMVSIEGGQITIEFKKRGVEALAIYRRLRGTTTWTRIGTDSSSPNIDGHPPTNPAVPEVRE